MKHYRFTAVIEWDSETQLYVGIIPGLSGAHTQASTLDELKRNLQEVTELCLEESISNGEISFSEFVGTQAVEVSR